MARANKLLGLAPGRSELCTNCDLHRLQLAAECWPETVWLCPKRLCDRGWFFLGTECLCAIAGCAKAVHLYAAEIGTSGWLRRLHCVMASAKV